MLDASSAVGTTTRQPPISWISDNLKRGSRWSLDTIDGSRFKRWGANPDLPALRRKLILRVFSGMLCLTPNPPKGRSRAGQGRDERFGKEAAEPWSVEIRLGAESERRGQRLLTTEGGCGGGDQLGRWQ